MYLNAAEWTDSLSSVPGAFIGAIVGGSIGALVAWRSFAAQRRAFASDRAQELAERAEEKSKQDYNTLSKTNNDRQAARRDVRWGVMERLHERIDAMVLAVIDGDESAMDSARLRFNIDGRRWALSWTGEDSDIAQNFVRQEVAEFWRQTRVYARLPEGRRRAEARTQLLLQMQALDERLWVWHASDGVRTGILMMNWEDYAANHLEERPYVVDDPDSEPKWGNDYQPPTRSRQPRNGT
ncbi:hypothetical protein B7R54_15110 [Subtercola boreus]|uniref:Uncharacterized protein n=1 Tax=Subtercola boreus TaxID=120213 RepID=A0A3E0VL72_9MICO|nr:hypothetical protein [Subtercola boreus]RFA10385.1 hypothetical protein B7R54_15110 [Subtercola boreus]TQL56099.1 hypothetical protein FB464_3681 [Subtercola boreus]